MLLVTISAHALVAAPTSTVVIAAVGLAMPGLRAMAGKLAAGHRGDTDNIDAELVATFVTRLREADVDQPKVLRRLLWAAERAARKIRYADTRADTQDLEPAGPHAPLRPWDRQWRAAGERRLIQAIRAGDLSTVVLRQRAGSRTHAGQPDADGQATADARSRRLRVRRSAIS